MGGASRSPSLGAPRPQPLVRLRPRAPRGVRRCPLSSHSPSGACGAAGVHAGGQRRGQPGLGQRPPGARSLPRAARGGRAPVPGAAPGPGPSPPGPERPHAWPQPLLGRAVPGGAPPGLHAPCAAARGYAGVCWARGAPSAKPSRPAPSRVWGGALPFRPGPPLDLQMGAGRGVWRSDRFSLRPLFLSGVKVPSASEPLRLRTDPHSIRNSGTHRA